MSTGKENEENFDRLCAHLNADSLAAVLVRAYRAPGGASPYEAMKAVVNARFEQLRSTLAGPKA